MASPINRSSRLNKTLYTLPVHCLTDADLKLENAKGVMQHFHSPENRHNRFLASLTAQERTILRNVERPLPYSTKQQQQQHQQQCLEAWRPGTAPPACSMQPTSTGASRTKHCNSGSLSSICRGRHAGQHTDAAIEQAMCTTTQKGVPCYSMEAFVRADVIEGRPASGSEESWRVAVVKSYSVPSSKYGHGEAGTQAFHQKYGWYRYNGFAGKGAKTSWASNPTKHLNSAGMKR